jgi:hypothetical protein
MLPVAPSDMDQPLIDLDAWHLVNKDSSQVSSPPIGNSERNINSGFGASSFAPVTEWRAA